MCLLFTSLVRILHGNDDMPSQDFYWLKHTHVYRQTQWRHIQTYSMYKEKKRIYRKLGLQDNCTIRTIVICLIVLI